MWYNPEQKDEIGRSSFNSGQRKSSNSFLHLYSIVVFLLLCLLLVDWLRVRGWLLFLWTLHHRQLRHCCLRSASWRFDLWCSIFYIRECRRIVVGQGQSTLLLTLAYQNPTAPADVETNAKHGEARWLQQKRRGWESCVLRVADVGDWKVRN